MAVKSSTTEGLNGRDTIAPNVDERPKAGGTAADSASQAVSALTADEGTGRAAYQAGMGPGKSIRRRSNINFGLLLSSVPTPTLPKLSTYSGAYAIAGIGAAADTDRREPPPGPITNYGASRQPELDGTQVEAFPAPVANEQYPSVVGERIKPFHKRREGRIMLIVVALLLVSLATILAVFLASNGEEEESDDIEFAITTNEPTMKPTYDPRSTLEIVRERGYLNCGVDGSTYWGGAVNFGAFAADFCRIVASVALGSPDKVNFTSVAGDRFIKLHERLVDVLFAGDILTLDKAVREPTTGLKFLFGSVYYTSSVVYLGEQEYIRCASDGKRYGDCEDLAVCAVDSTEIRKLIPTILPGPWN